jgi:hypothetical protein
MTEAQHGDGQAAFWHVKQLRECERIEQRNPTHAESFGSRGQP